ncbi:ThuA domain-containing protein [Pedobacter sandarakinus]|uniref:ThuA domain-containing protein n=1 Tax=Pedobacter sandarakinus TaxID=353156 RepID=UPI0022470768|nr:ThuA domain-containing protein [Pedobacter sandarakinus]MCX2574172.1 ThuA domain-containing protein [Pedobacter sandarakinus]
MNGQQIEIKRPAPPVRSLKTFSIGFLGVFCFLQFILINGFAQNKVDRFNVIAFFTAKNDLAHISFVNEANKIFPEMARANHFTYDTTSNWDNLNLHFLSKYQVVLFLDTRPEKPEQRQAFQAYMETGGAWMGFHFSAFSMEKSKFDTNWNWYHNEFLACGPYVSNTWRPTSAILKIESPKHPIAAGLPQKFKSQPNEWYKWSNDLRTNPDIEILLSIDNSSFPLGTGPKQHEIWNQGYYPVVWTNKKYRMVYMNMGHDDMDYEHLYDNSNRSLSSTFNSAEQNKLILNSLLWLGSGKKSKPLH